MENIIAKFIEETLKRAGIADLPDEFKKDYTDKLGVEVQKRLGMMALAELKEDDLKDFEDLMNGKAAPKSEELLEFFRSRVSDFDNKLADVLKKFADEFVQGAERLKGVKLNP